MTGPATTRMSLEPTPGGLGLVQDLVNTSTTHPSSTWPDLLADTDTAQEGPSPLSLAWRPSSRTVFLTFYGRTLEGARQLPAQPGSRYNGQQQPGWPAGVHLRPASAG